MDIRKNYALLDTVNSVQLRLQDCGYAVLDNRWKAEQICSPYNRLYLVESGESFLFTDSQQITMEPGKVYLIPAGRSFGYRCEKEMTKLYFHVELEKEDGSDLLQSLGKILELPLERGWMEPLLRHFSGSGFADALAVRECLYRILVAFDRSFAIARGRGQHRSDHVTDTILYIQNNLSASLQVEELAQRRFISRAYLEKLFRQQVGMSLGQYIDDQLMGTAQWWLEQTGRSVAYISQELGYQDPCYFSRRFKQLRGVTPLQYRRRTRT